MGHAAHGQIVLDSTKRREGSQACWRLRARSRIQSCRKFLSSMTTSPHGWRVLEQWRHSNAEQWKVEAIESAFRWRGYRFGYFKWDCLISLMHTTSLDPMESTRIWRRNYSAATPHVVTTRASPTR